MVRVWESNIIFPFVCLVSVHLSVTLSPPKPLGGIEPNLLHDLPSWYGCGRASPSVSHAISDISNERGDLQWPSDLDLHCLPFRMWSYISNLDQVIWLAKNRCSILIYSAGQGLTDILSVALLCLVVWKGLMSDRKCRPWSDCSEATLFAQTFLSHTYCKYKWLKKKKKKKEVEKSIMLVFILFKFPVVFVFSRWVNEYQLCIEADQGAGNQVGVSSENCGKFSGSYV